MTCPHCGKPVRLVADAPRPAQPTKPADGPVNLAEIIGSIDLRSLKPNERTFVEKQTARFDRYGAEAFISEKQLAWLKDLAKRRADGGPITDDDVPF